MLLTVLACSLFCTGLYACGQRGKIFFSLSCWLSEKIGEYSNPIINCLTCMASLWGTLFYWTVFYFSGDYTNLLLAGVKWLCFIFMVAGLNWCIDLTTNLLKSLITYFQKKTELMIKTQLQNGKTNSD